MNKKPNPFSKENLWTDKQIKDLNKYYAAKDAAFISEKVGKSAAAIRAMAIKLRLKKENHFWKNSDEKFVLKNWEVLDPIEMGEKVGKTKWAVINKYRELIGKRKGHKKLPGI